MDCLPNVCEAKAHVYVVSFEPVTQIKGSGVGKCPTVFYKIVSRTA